MSSQSAVASAISTHTLTVEQKRVFLHRAMFKHPRDQRVRKALLETFTPTLIQQAADHGVYVC